MRDSPLRLGVLLAALSACSGLAGRSTSTGAVVAGPAPRPRPPIVAADCAGLSAQELREASDYVLQLSRVEALYHSDDIRFTPAQLADNPSLIVGVAMFLPAERGLNRAYLERLLSCHAVQPPGLGDHPNDPLLSFGITSIDVHDADGGQYRISVTAERRNDALGILRRAEALHKAGGSVRVQQSP